MSVPLSLLLPLQLALASPGPAHEVVPDPGHLDGTTPVYNPSGYLVVAPDRGFLGNEEVRDAFELFREREPRSALTFVTSDRPEENFREGLEALGNEALGIEGPDELVILPLFLSRHEDLYRRMLDAAEEMAPEATVAEPFGASYLAEELLFDRVEALVTGSGGELPRHGHGMRGRGGGGADAPHRLALAVVAHGASSEDDAGAIRADLEPLVDRARRKFGVDTGEIVIEHDGAESTTADRVSEIAARHERTFVVPFNLTHRATTMMSHWAGLERRLAGIEGVVADGRGVLPHGNVHRWMLRTAAAHRELRPEEVGVIFVPHGADYNWNQGMRKALAPVAARHPTAEAFSMVDPPVVKRAVRELEERGLRAGILLRIFSLEESFRGRAEYILGLREEYGGGMGGPFPPRISTHLHMTTVGGLEDHRLFALGLLDRAMELSSDPSRETVILLGHGAGDEEGNERWLRNLATIADTMRAHGGDAFRAIRYDTWQEDWPERLEENVERIRSTVDEANRNGGRALVVPARTTGQGRARRYLEGLDFAYGEGFAPHPHFVEWVEEEIERGIEVLEGASGGKERSPSAPAGR